MKKVTHKEQIEKKLQGLNLKIILGCYDKEIELIPQNSFKNILDSITGDSTDVFLTIRKKLYIIEISVVNNEIDFKMCSGVNYFSYRSVEECFDNGDITEEQYEVYARK